MGRKAEPGKDKWRKCIHRGRKEFADARGRLAELRTYIYKLREVNQGNLEGAKFLDEMSTLIDSTAQSTNNAEVELINLLAIVEDEGND